MESRETTPAERDIVEDDMHFPSKGRFEYNLNTMVILGGILIGFGGYGVLWGSFSTKVELSDKRVTDWIERHEKEHKDRQAIIDSLFSRFDERISRVTQETQKIENIVYRVTVAEQTGINISNSVKELTSAVSLLTADMRVIRTILESDDRPRVPAQSRRP